MGLCYWFGLWVWVIGLCYGFVLWVCVMGLGYWFVLWVWVMGLCYGFGLLSSESKARLLYVNGVSVDNMTISP
jgi:hypothetical protein